MEARTMNREAMFEKIGKDAKGKKLIDGLPEEFVFDVEKVPLLYTGLDGNTKRLDGKSTVINKTTGKAYGPVSDNYCPIANREALGSVGYIKDMTLRKYGEAKNGTQWLIGELPERKILGDEFKPFVVFRNSFSGASMIQMAMAPLRVVCKNQISMAIRTSNYSYSLRHTKNAGEKMEEAHVIMNKAINFMDDLEHQAEYFAKLKVGGKETEAIVDEMFPVNPKESELQQERAIARRAAFIEALRAPDLANFGGTAWGLINAYSDVITHYQPVRTTETVQENRFLTITFDPRWMSAFIKAVQRVAA